MLLQKASKTYLETIKVLLMEGKSAKAIDILVDITKEVSNDLYNQIIIQSASYKNLVRERTLLSDDFYRLQMARTNAAILEIVDQIPIEQQLLASLKSLKLNEVNNLLTPSFDDLEKIIGEKSELFEINWLQKAMKASKSICRILCDDRTSGTGFILKGGYLMTNNHVLPNKIKAEHAKIQFNYKIDIDNNLESIYEYFLDTSVFKTSKYCGNGTNNLNGLDYTIVKIKDDPNAPLIDREFLEIEDVTPPLCGDKVNIIQHPEGKTMKIALPDKVLSVWKQFIFYEVDTKGGSSGSPVFNQEWKVIALHHAGKNKDSITGGLQINEVGDIRPANRGVLLKSILADLDIELQNEIL